MPPLGGAGLELRFTTHLVQTTASVKAVRAAVETAGVYLTSLELVVKQKPG